MTPVLNTLSSALHHAHDAANASTPHNIEAFAKRFAEESLHNGEELKDRDVCIQFIGATDLPRMDVMGLADPYFIATIDGRLKHISPIQTQTLTPVWNSVWRLSRLPPTAVLKVSVYDRDEGHAIDDYIGCFETTLSSGTKEVEIVGPVTKAVRGHFWVKVSSSPTTDSAALPYTFAGPVRYTRHNSPTVGRLTNLNDERLYSTWRIHIKGIPATFGDRVQPWNRSYKAAQSIFQGPSSVALKSSIMAGHSMLYALRATDGYGELETREDVYALLRGGKAKHRVKPAVYTYIIATQDDTLRFSETGAAFFVDFASKHALHSNCAESVRYSGEFHPRPQGGWDQFSDDIPDDAVRWELVIDNNSGTYSPDKTLLPAVKRLLEANFPGFAVFALDHGDEELHASREACRAYALQHRGVHQRDLQPHTAEGEETLQHSAFPV